MTQIRITVVIDASPEKIYPLIATAQGLSQWWAADVTEGGGTWILVFQSRYVYRPQLVRSNRESEWRCLTGQEWSGTRLLFNWADNNGKTLLRFSQADWNAETEYFVGCTATWGELTYRLKATAEGKAPGPFFPPRDWHIEFRAIALWLSSCRRQSVKRSGSFGVLGFAELFEGGDILKDRVNDVLIAEL